MDLVLSRIKTGSQSWDGFDLGSYSVPDLVLVLQLSFCASSVQPVEGWSEPRRATGPAWEAPSDTSIAALVYHHVDDEGELEIRDFSRRL